MVTTQSPDLRTFAFAFEVISFDGVCSVQCFDTVGWVTGL